MTNTAALVFDAENEDATARLGRKLAELLPTSCVVALNGTLGAGKTRLVQALAEASGINRRDVVSPTFVLVQEYHGNRTIYHVDAYRVRDEDEFFALGVEEYFRLPALVLIEWAERIENCLPPDRVEIAIEVTGNESRRFTISGTGAEPARFLDALSKRLATE
jgi:tRNA threonylcarbamoyladenosine biosynthesis protein TsaE